jgi:hypothetical protein
MIQNIPSPRVSSPSKRMASPLRISSPIKRTVLVPMLVEVELSPMAIHTY